MIDNAKTVMSELLQSCRNIMAATAGKSLPDAFDKEPFLLENIYMNLIILVESYIRIGDGKSDYPTINWEEIGSYTNVVKLPADKVERSLICSIIKNKIPSLTAKLERIFEAGV